MALTKKQIDELKELFERTTQGKWHSVPHPEFAGADHRIADDPNKDWAAFGQVATASANNSPFIVAVHNAFPAILEMLEAATSRPQRPPECDDIECYDLTPHHAHR